MLTLEQQNYAYLAYQETIKNASMGKSLMHPEFSEFSEMYVFATENLKDYLKKLNIEGKDVLTVAASGDQLINLALLGAKRIVNFDINKNASFIIQLKVAALNTLSYEEFLNFFTKSESEKLGFAGIIPQQQTVNLNEKAFEYKTYLRIKVKLSSEAALYWDMIYQEYEYTGEKLRDSKIFHNASSEGAIYNNEYLETEDKYNLAAERIKEIEYEFYNKDILELHTLPGTFDAILLSNIYVYLIDEWYAKISGEEFVNYITNELSSKLNPNGVIPLAYQFNHRERAQIHGNALQKLFQKKYKVTGVDDFENRSFKKILVPSVTKEYRKTGTEDCIYIYEHTGKKRK